MQRISVLSLLSSLLALLAVGPTAWASVTASPPDDFTVTPADLEILRNISRQLHRVEVGDRDRAQRHALEHLGIELDMVRRRQELRLARSQYRKVKADYEATAKLYEISAAKRGGSDWETTALEEEARELHQELIQLRVEWDQIVALIKECRKMENKRHELIILIDARK